MQQHLHLPKKSKLPLLIFGGEIIVLLIILSTQLKALSSPHPDIMLTSPSKEQTPLFMKIDGITQLEHDIYPTQENYYFLYQKTNKSKDALKGEAQYIKDNFCKNACTINFYDDKRAFTIDHERVIITSTPVMQEWNTNNYVFVADHYLGYLPFAKYASFAYYPFKDWYYQKLKAKN